MHNVIDISMDHLLAQHKRRPQQLLPLHLHDGSLLFAQVQTDHAVLPSSTTTTHNTAPSDALSALDSGDLNWRSAADKTRRVLDKSIAVLIQGESGVGKEYFARAAHDSSARRDQPFVTINCAAIPENLIEAELFGYVPGAFTGAKKEGSNGRLREAHGGTLFLDEIGDMPLHMQTRLLRVLQERSVTPLGSGKSVPVDFALLCATHCRLRDEIDQGKFRSDLYYRINGLTVQLPALRERSDFCALADKILGELHPARGVFIAPALLEQMRNYTWPGNLRQLSSVLRTASAMLDADETCIEWKHLPDDIAQDLLGLQQPCATREKELTQNLKELSRTAIDHALQSSRGNISLAARLLGISRQTLYRKLQTQTA